MGELRGYEAWMLALTNQDLPTLNTVVKDICEFSGRDKTRADELTKIILRDANLTSKVLKIANSVHYNHSLVPIKTVSRGIVQLGLDNLKNIALATCLIDSLMNGKYKAMIVDCLARSFHAAVQARALVPLLSHELKEQVFIAALLRNIGELALLASEHAEAERFVTERNLNPEEESAIAVAHLGVDIQLINKGIIEAWSLTELVFPVGSSSEHPTAMNGAIQLGIEISRHIHKGLHAPAMQKLYTQVAAMNRITLSAAKAQVKQMAEEAAIIAKCYGVNTSVEPAAVKEPVAAPVVRTGYEFQQHMNQMLAAIMSGQGLARVMQLAVNALHEGAAIARVSIVMVDYRTQCLEFRYTAGVDVHVWRDVIHVDFASLRKGELLRDFLTSLEPVWFQLDDNESERTLGVLGQIVTCGDLMLAPIKIDKRLLAFVYADAVGQRLSHRQFEEFQLVSNQLNFMLKMNPHSR